MQGPPALGFSWEDLLTWPQAVTLFIPLPTPLDGRAAARGIAQPLSVVPVASAALAMVTQCLWGSVPKVVGCGVAWSSDVWLGVGATQEFRSCDPWP